MIEETAERRNELKQQIQELSDKRSAYLKKKVYLSSSQIEKLNNAILSKSSVTLRINPKLKGNKEILITPTQARKFSDRDIFHLTLSKSQINSMIKHGGFIFSLPTLLAGATALGSLAGSASAIAKTINENKIAKKRLREEKRHNKEMEVRGRGFFLKRHRRQ